MEEDEEVLEKRVRDDDVSAYGEAAMSKDNVSQDSLNWLEYTYGSTLYLLTDTLNPNHNNKNKPKVHAQTCWTVS